MKRPYVFLYGFLLLWAAPLTGAGEPEPLPWHARFRLAAGGNLTIPPVADLKDYFGLLDSFTLKPGVGFSAFADYRLWRGLLLGGRYHFSAIFSPNRFLEEYLLHDISFYVGWRFDLSGGGAIEPRVGGGLTFNQLTGLRAAGATDITGSGVSLDYSAPAVSLGLYGSGALNPYLALFVGVEIAVVLAADTVYPLISVNFGLAFTLDGFVVGRQLRKAAPQPSVIAQDALIADPQKHTVRFIDWDGSELKTEIVANGAFAVPPLPASRPGHIFSHWSDTFDKVEADKVIVALYDPVKGPQKEMINVEEANLPLNDWLAALNCASYQSQDIRVETRQDELLVRVINFDPYAIALNDNQKAQLHLLGERLLNDLQKYGFRIVAVNGYANPTGARWEGSRLRKISTARAQSVAAFLKKAGLAVNLVKGRGAWRDSYAAVLTDQKRARNRQVEIIIHFAEPSPAQPD